MEQCLNGNLFLAIAEAGVTSVAAANAISRTDFIATGFHPCRYFTISCENSSVVNQDNLLEENFEDDVSIIPNVFTGKSLTRLVHMHELLCSYASQSMI